MTILGRRFRLRHRDERGAIAIMAGFLCVIVFTLAAMSVDLGNSIARRTDTQTQADFGAYAAAQQLSNTAKAGTTVSTPLANAVATAMNNNQPQDDHPQSTNCVTNKNCVTGAQLKNGTISDGELQFTNQGLLVTAPQNYVDYGFANILGIAGNTVHGTATVNIYSPGLRVLPMFAVLGCDYGLQTLADPANGHDTPVVPTLAFNSETNNTKISNSAGLVLTDSTGLTVNSLALNSTGNKLTITASQWDSYYVGFFRGDDTNPTLVATATVPGAVPGTSTSYTKSPATPVTVNIPDIVTQTETAWYVRIYDDSGADKGTKPITVPHTGTWSPAGEALGIRVGNAVLQCAQGSSDGNFGSLKLPRTDVNPSGWLPVNIATGLQTPLSLTKHQQWATDSPPGKCFDAVNGAVTSPSSPPTLVPQTNCVSTDTGLPANDATQGLVSGANGFPGLLTTKPTAPNCAPDGSSANRSVSVNGPGGGTFSIDNSVLTCYFTNTTTSIADIATASYNKGAVLDKSIIDDPRFVWVPVVAVKPDCGTCSNYSIIDIRPGFITDQQPISQSTKNSTAAQNGVTADNAVTITNNGITSLKVVFFNIDAMPRDVNNKVIDYLGVGQRIVRLIN